MTALTCDVCGSNLSTDTDGADFVVCELCGARKVLEKAEPAESEPEPDNSATTPNSSDVPTETEKKADAPAGYVIPQKFSNAPFERAKADLEKQIRDVNTNNVDLRNSINKAKNDASKCERELLELEGFKRNCLATREYTKLVFADDPHDPRFAEGMRNNTKHLFEIKSNIDNKNEERVKNLNLIPPLENDISRNDRKLITLRAELESVKDELRKTPAQRAEECYQQLLNEKRTASTDDDFAELATKFNELEDYKDAKSQKNECIRRAVAIGYENMFQRKKDFDANPSTTDEEYALLARNVRLLREFNIEELVQKCEDLAGECEKAAEEARYKRLVEAKGKASADETECRALAEQFRAMNGYKDTTELAEDCEERYIKLKERREERERQEQERKRLEEERQRQEEERRRQEQYDRLVQAMNAASTEEEYRQAAEDFKWMGVDGYKDTGALADRCEAQRDRLREEREERERKEREVARRRARNRLTIGIAAVFVLVFGVVAAYYLTRPSVESLFDTGKGYFEANNFADAAVYFSKAIKRSPRDAEFRDWRGWAYFERGDYKSASSDFSEAARLAPDAVDYRLRLGSTYSNMKNHDGAVTAYTQAIRLDPNNALYYCLRGDANVEKNAGPAAIADYTQAIRLDPNEARYHNSRGSEFRKAEEYGKAIADHTEAIRLNPSEARYYNNRGVAHVIKKDYPKAIPDFSEAIRLAPDNAKYRNNRGDVRILTKDFTGAAADYREAVRLDRDNAKYRSNLEKAEERLAKQRRRR